MDRLGGLVVIAPARRAGDPGSIPGPGENFSLKLLLLNIVDFGMFYIGAADCATIAVSNIAFFR